jgi:hypothetical protein
MEKIMPFFKSAQEKPVLPRSRRELVDVGGNGDCGFRAIAAGWIDNFLHYPQLDKESLSILLENHFKYYPEHRPELTGLVAPKDKMSRLIGAIERPRLIQALAYTLRQIAVDKMVSSPVEYQGAFVENNESTSPAKMRHHQTWIDETSVCALADALNVPIQVRAVFPGAKIPMPPREYNAQSFNFVTNPRIEIELENKHYRPYLLDNASFESDVYDSQPFIAPVMHAVAEEDMDKILQVIKEEDARIEAEYLSTRARLSGMVRAGELTKDMLLELYIKGMGHSEYLQGRVRHVDLEQKATFFSEAIEDAKSRRLAAAASSFDADIINEMVYSISRAVSVGDMSADIVFAQIEELQQPSSRASAPAI